MGAKKGLTQNKQRVDPIKMSFSVLFSPVQFTFQRKLPQCFNLLDRAADGLIIRRNTLV